MPWRHQLVTPGASVMLTTSSLPIPTSNQRLIVSVLLLSVVLFRKFVQEDGKFLSQGSPNIPKEQLCVGYYIVCRYLDTKRKEILIA